MSKREELEEKQVSEFEVLRIENEKLRKEILFYSAKAFEAEKVAEIYYLVAKNLEEKLVRKAH